MSERCAPRNTSKAFASGDLTLTVASGLPVHVYGIWLSNPTAGALSFTVNNGAGTLICTVDVPATSSKELSTYWIADAGVQIVAEAADTFAVVFHNSPGR